MPWFLDCFLPEESSDGSFISFFVASVYPGYFYPLKILSNWSIWFKSNVLLELFLHISEENLMLSPDQKDTQYL